MIANIAYVRHGILVVIPIYMVQHDSFSFKYFVTMYTNDAGVSIVLLEMEFDDISVLSVKSPIAELTDPPSVFGTVFLINVLLNAGQRLVTNATGRTAKSLLILNVFLLSVNLHTFRAIRTKFTEGTLNFLHAQSL